MVLAIVLGCFCNSWALDAATTKEVAGHSSILADIFLRLIKMVIAPLVFGIASMCDATAIGPKWFLRRLLPDVRLNLRRWRRVFAFLGCRPDEPGQPL
jgi:hypothetical protein